MLNKPTVDSKRRLQALRRWQARLLTASAVNFASCSIIELHIS